MKTRREKQQEAEQLRQELAHVSTVILTTFQGIKVQEETELRRAVESAGGRYRVIKNSVAERAATGTPAERILKGLTGPNAISYTAADAVALARTLTRLAREIPALQFRAGVVEGRVVSVEEIAALAELPSREELLGRIAFLLRSAAARLAQALAGVPRGLAVAVQEAVKAEKFAQS
jgi:large subunit ribosomal protein L10